MNVKQLKKIFEVRAAWIRACQYDGIDPNSPLVSFSKENPHVKEHNAAMIELQKLAAS